MKIQSIGNILKWKSDYIYVFCYIEHGGAKYKDYIVLIWYAAFSPADSNCDSSEFTPNECLSMERSMLWKHFNQAGGD